MPEQAFQLNSMRHPTESNFCLLEAVDAEGNPSKLVGEFDRGSFLRNTIYRFEGRWVEDPRFGRQFKFRSYTQEKPHNRESIESYLCKYASGIGPKSAAKLWDCYGPDAVSSLRESPEDAAALCGLRVQTCREAARGLQAEYEFEQTRIELHSLLSGRGFSKAMPNNCIKKWGVAAGDVIRRDPFKLLTAGFKSAGFVRCDKLYCDMGLPRDRLKRQLICLWHIIKSGNDGHTWHQGQAVSAKMAHLVAAKIQFVRVLKFGHKAKVLSIRKESDGCWVALRQHATAEFVLAEAIRGLME